jgi:hypothetical protein
VDGAVEEDLGPCPLGGGGRAQWPMSCSSGSRSCSSGCACSTFAVRRDSRGVKPMSAEYVVMGTVAIGILAYLVWALLFPERL